MKNLENITKVIALAALSMILSVSVVFGQNPCTDEYEGPFISGNVTGVVHPDLLNGQDGTITVSFEEYRNIGQPMFYINQITSYPPNLIGASSDVIFKRAIIEILKEDFRQNPSSYPKYVWFLYPTCWYVDDVTDELKPCDETLCCKVQYYIDIDPSNNEPYIVTQVLESEGDDCLNQTPPGGAGEGSCEYVCESMDFGPDIPVKIFPGVPFDCPTCTFDKYYKTNELFNGINIQIDYNIYQCQNDIEVIIHSIISTDGLSLGTDKAEIMRFAVQKVLKDASINNPPDPIDDITLIIRSCWNLTSGNAAMYPCVYDDEHCCYANFQVTHNGPDDYTAAFLGWGPRSANDCNYYSCEYVCENNYIGPLPDPLKRSVPYAETGIEINNFEVNPNPATGMTEISVGSKYNGELRILVYDLIGSEIINKKVKKSTPFIKSELDLSSLPDGIYFISIEINGKLSAIKRLMILK